MSGFLSRAVLSAWALCSAAAASAAPPTDAAGWQAWARADLDVVHARIVAGHPGVIDPQNPGFNVWVEQGYAEAQALLPNVVSYDTALSVLRYYTIGFEDGHLGVSDDVRLNDYPIFVTGWHVAWQDDRYVVTAAMPDWKQPLPPVGATWIGCDGQAPDDVVQARTARFYSGSPRDVARWLWLQVPLPEPLRECTFRTAQGETLALAVSYQPIASEPFFATLWATQDDSPAPANDFVLDDGVLWVRAGNFDLRADTDDMAQLERMLAGLEETTGVRAIVFDARGNHGGDSSIGGRIFTAATGGLEFDQTGLDTLPRYHAEWRVTPYLVSVLDNYVVEAAKLYGADSARAAEQQAFRDEVAAALAAGKPWVDQDVGPSITPADIAARNGRLRRFDGKVALLTDGACVSACLDFADFVLRVPGVVHVGATTGADSVYLVGSRSRLPSGNTMVLPVKVWRGRPRGNNEAYVPAAAVDLGQDEAAIRRDVLQALDAG
jgi:hypothetical protein